MKALLQNGFIDLLKGGSNACLFMEESNCVSTKEPES